VIARRIIEGRLYRSVEELERVKGIGKKRLEEIRLGVMVEGAATPPDPVPSGIGPRRSSPVN
jgi:hypothetical protein